MDHLQVQQYLDEYLSDELSPSERDEVEKHLETCEHCRKWAEMIRLQKETFAGLEKTVEVPELSAAFVDRLPARRRFSPTRIAPIAATLVLVLGLGILSLRFTGLSAARSSDAAAPEAAMDIAMMADTVLTSETAMKTDTAQDVIVTDDCDDVVMIDDAADGSTRGWEGNAGGEIPYVTNDYDYSSDDSIYSAIDTKDALVDEAASDTNESFDKAFPEEDGSSSLEKDISFSVLADTESASVIGGADAPTSIAVTDASALSFIEIHASWLVPCAVGLIALLISSVVWLIVRRKY